MVIRTGHERKFSDILEKKNEFVQFVKSVIRLYYNRLTDGGKDSFRFWGWVQCNPPISISTRGMQDAKTEIPTGKRRQIQIRIQ